MPYWMTNPEHGLMPVYDLGEVERNKKHGWSLLNQGESPDFSAKDKKPEPVAEVKEAKPVDLSQLQPDKPEIPSDPLDRPVVQILPEFPGMTLQALEEMRAAESQGKARKGLMTALADEIERRRG